MPAAPLPRRQSDAATSAVRPRPWVFYLVDATGRKVKAGRREVKAGNAYNQDSYFYAGGNIAGTATFAYATGAGVTRVGAFAAGYAPTATYIVGAGATAYGGYLLYEHTINFNKSSAKSLNIN